jgi:hypothetical protein
VSEALAIRQRRFLLESNLRSSALFFGDAAAGPLAMSAILFDRDQVDHLDGLSNRLACPSGRAVFHDFVRYIHVTTYSPCEHEDEDLIALECVVGENWVVTAHDRDLAVLQEFAERVSSVWVRARGLLGRSTTAPLSGIH